MPPVGSQRDCNELLIGVNDRYNGEKGLQRGCEGLGRCLEIVGLERTGRNSGVAGRVSCEKSMIFDDGFSSLDPEPKWESLSGSYKGL